MATRDEGNKAVAACLVTCLANATVMYHRAHGFHWNVTGPDFPEWHEKFLEIYEDVYDSLDPMAENIRKVGSFAPFTLDELTAEATVSDGVIETYNSASLAADLLKTNNGVLASLNKCFQVATAHNQQGIANFIAERIDAHQKWAWQLSASV